MDENSMESNDIRINFRSLSDEFSEASQDLESPDLQIDHPAMNGLRDIVHYNCMDEEEQQSYEEHSYRAGKPLPIKDSFEAMQEATTGKVDKSGMEEKFYRGLMEDHRYEQYKKDKKDNPDITAKQFWEHYVKQYEPENVKSMERAFRSIMQEPPREKRDNTPFISREQVENMSREEIKRNYDAIKKSEKKWK